MTFWAAVIQFLSAATAGALGGFFVLLGVRDQFRRQGEAACRALLLEVRANRHALVEMIKLLPSGDWPAGKPNPGWLHRSIWDSQVPYVAQLLDQRTLELVVGAYATLESVPEMRLPNWVGPGIPYQRGGWVNDCITHAYEAFRPASEYLGDLVADQDRKAQLPWMKKMGAGIHRLSGRSK